MPLLTIICKVCISEKDLKNTNEKKTGYSLEVSTAVACKGSIIHCIQEFLDSKGNKGYRNSEKSVVYKSYSLIFLPVKTIS